MLEGLFHVTECISKNYIEISANGVTNRYYLFGGRDESSYTLVQGITLAGVLLDEVALMPRSFVEQMLARCSVAGSKLWFNCNPESPAHWFLKEWIEKADSGKRPDVLHLHFTMNDNLSLSQSIKDRYEKMYSGVFYDRYILGLWRKAEGLVYPMFDENQHVVKGSINPDGVFYVSIDYGTLNPCSMGLWCVRGKNAVRIKEFYYNGREKNVLMTDEEYYIALEALVGNKPIREVIVDPSAASFIECIRRHGRFRVLHAVNAVNDGIRVVMQALKGGLINFHESCKDTIREFALYSWDEKTTTGDDKVLKENDHAMDDIRYFCSTILRREFRWIDWGKPDKPDGK